MRLGAVWIEEPGFNKNKSNAHDSVTYLEKDLPEETAASIMEAFPSQIYSTLPGASTFLLHEWVRHKALACVPNDRSFV